MVSGNWFTYFSGTSSTVGSVDSKQTINPETEPTTTTGTHVASRTQLELQLLPVRNLNH